MPQRTLEFKRTTRFGKFPAKVRKEWLDTTKKYRITYRSEVEGIKVPAKFYAFKLEIINDRDFWDFIERHRQYKTFKTAVTACENDLNGIKQEKEACTRKRKLRRKLTTQS